MKSNLNEENLNYLSEAVSNMLSDDSENESKRGLKIDKDNKQKITSNLNLSPSYVQKKSNCPKMKISKKDDINSLRYKIYEINKIMEQNSMLIFQKDEKIKELENSNFENKRLMQVKFSKYDKLKKEFKNKSEKLIELENENNLLKFEIRKIQDENRYKDTTINEIQSIIKMTNNKFKCLEEKNQFLKEENDKFKKENSECRNSVNNLSHQNDILTNKNLNELKSIKQNFELTILELKQELVRKEEALKQKYEENEKSYKSKLSKREEDLKQEYINEIAKISGNLESSRIENEKLRIENNRLQGSLEDCQNAIQEKSLEFKKNIEIKDKSYEKLLKSLKDVQKETKDIEIKYNSQNTDLQIKLKLCEENENKLKNEIVKREKIINDIENEIYKLKQFIEDYECKIKEFNIKLENKESVIEELKSQNNEIITEFNKKISEFEDFQKEKIKENEELGIQLKDFYEDKRNQELKEIKMELDIAYNKIKELNDLMEEKYKAFNEEIIKERQIKDSLERNNKALIKKMRDIEEKYQNEISNLSNNYKNYEREVTLKKEKYDNKIKKLKIKLEEETVTKENLMKEVKSIMESKMNLERTPMCLKNDTFYSKFDPLIQYKSNINVDANQLLETLKEINMKIDEKI